MHPRMNLRHPSIPLMATWTGPHANCGDTPSPRDGRPIIAGDIFSMRESVYAAIYDVLYHSNVADRTLYSQSRLAAHDLMRKEHATKKIRPCIMMRDDTDPLSVCKPRTICVTTSWEKTPLTDLPELFQLFSVPLFPNRRISRENPDHYHSLPGEWDIEDAFVFAWEFESRRSIINRWPSKEPGDPPKEPVVFGKVAQARLAQDCVNKREEWVRKCRLDPKFADKHARDCLKHLKKLDAERAKDQSSHSQAAFNFPSQKSRMAVQACRSRTSISSWKSHLSIMSAGSRRGAGGCESESWRRVRPGLHRSCA
ncbi:hypothetical protein L226DRAFT_176080 [Lentinus tigrinus ALCF2SS1-7]|uniref:uncharacterized protein n=1 Tax=Lentinus tigrinus ALCF2SS1-7 TaxID=1328758 RepID=UPI001166245D|nr:hypothetical protein L226DRAFT_176080 [Lentinus tigrinus ALCF2SS1-7]